MLPPLTAKTPPYAGLAISPGGGRPNRGGPGGAEIIPLPPKARFVAKVLFAIVVEPEAWTTAPPIGKPYPNAAAETGGIGKPLINTILNTVVMAFSPWQRLLLILHPIITTVPLVL